MQPWSRRFAGRLEEATIESAALRGNPLDDPSERPLWVYLPPGYDGEAASRYPVIYVLQGMTGQLDMWRNRSAFRPTVLERVDALFAGEGLEGAAAVEPPPPAIVVFVDCWTSVGGSQFLDSPGTGRYHTYLCEEVVPWVDRRYRTLAEPAHRGVTGKSSGGYGAMVTPMLRPDLFGGLATHAGDALFECCYLPEFPQAARALRDQYDGSFERFWADFRSRPAMTRTSDAILVNEYAMAACYSAEADGTIRLPFDPLTGALVPDVWERWLAWDPVRMVPRHAEAVRGLRAIYIDAGTRDEYFLDLGAEAYRRALAAAGAPAPFFELFDARHGGIEYRYPIAMRFLAERLAP
ncbi:MAG TPA: alpha/beta hydrolase-fold protein [Candidatus Limnocylindrales bacterium]